MRETRAGDFACRLGGEELAVMLIGCGAEAAKTKAEQLRQAIHALEVKADGNALGRVTASFGIASYPAAAGAAENLVRVADQALYRAKSAGRNRVEIAPALGPEQQAA